MSSRLAIKVIENELAFLNRLIEDKDRKIKELEQQLEQEKLKNAFNIGSIKAEPIERKFVSYNTL